MKSLQHASKSFFFGLLFSSSGLNTLAQTTDHDILKLIGSHEKITAKTETEHSFWIGTTNGVFEIRKKSGKVIHMTTENSLLPSNHISSVCAKSNGEIYIGTMKGILRYDCFAFIQLTTENSMLPNNYITAMTCDHLDNIWIGTEQNTLTMINKFGLKNFSAGMSPVKNDFINGFTESSTGMAIRFNSGESVNIQGVSRPELRASAIATALKN